MITNKPNKVRQKLMSGELVAGTAIYSASPNIVESIGCSGADFIRIDTEHGWRQDDSMDHMIRAALLSDVVPIVRVDRDNPYLIRKALELKAGGIIVPHVNTAADVREIVSASKFPPHGTRGFALQCSAAGWGTITGADYVNWANTEPLIGIMVESVHAMDEIDEMFAVDGLDFALFGAADYSFSLGLDSKQADNPEVRKGLLRTIQAAKKHGKWVMFGVGYDDAKAAEYINAGVNMIELGHDTGIVQWFLTQKTKTLVNGRKK